MKRWNLNIESNLFEFKITERINNAKKDAKSARINVWLKECCIV